MQNRKKKRSESEYKKKEYAISRSLPLILFQKCCLIPFVCFVRFYILFCQLVTNHENYIAFHLFQSLSEKRVKKMSPRQVFFSSGVSIHHYFLFKAPSSNALKSRIRNLETHNQHNTQQSDASAKDNVNALIYMYAKTGKLNRELSENPII